MCVRETRKDSSSSKGSVSMSATTSCPYSFQTILLTERVQLE